jgi:hypothetical protein
MIFLPPLTGALQIAVEELGLPLPVSVERNGDVCMILEVSFAPAELGGFTACIPGIAAFGEGESKEEAALALREAIRGYIEAFG